LNTLLFLIYFLKKVMSILNFEVLLKFSNNYAAKNLLQQISKHVIPIMKKRMWVVHNFCEFCPKDKHLLGLNVDRGETIRIRLRQHDNADEFIPLPELLDTMLHELAHIQEANHSRRFYALWDDLRDEWETNAVTSKVTLNTAEIEGNRLDTTKHNPSSMKDARLKALESAEKRAKLHQGDSTHILGGKIPSNATPQATPQELVRIATLNRLNGSSWCGTDDTKSVIEDWQCSSCTMINSISNKKCSACDSEKTEDASLIVNEPSLIVNEPNYDYFEPANEVVNNPNSKPTNDKEWKCSKCTLINMGGDVCQACDYKYELIVEWECKTCTFKNDSTNNTCDMCNEIN
jgi:DNA-dependent metalloprotease WSS1